MSLKTTHFFSFATLLGILTLGGCKSEKLSSIGFRDLEEVRHRVSNQAAQELLAQLKSGIATYHEVHHSYPVTTEEHLYDSVRTLIAVPIDPTYLYRNDGGKGYYMAVGGRLNRIVYRYPATVGPEDYSLYWIGMNGIDESGEGDDLSGWSSGDSVRQMERHRTIDLRNDGSKLQLVMTRSGTDLFKDSVTFIIREKDSVLFRDKWPLTAYFRYRPEITESERKRIVREELDKFLNSSQFVRTDSLTAHDWGTWDEFKPKTPEATEIMKSNELMFNYYAGTSGSRGIVWSPTRKKFIRVWKTPA